MQIGSSGYVPLHTSIQSTFGMVFEFLLIVWCRVVAGGGSLVGNGETIEAL